MEENIGLASSLLCFLFFFLTFGREHTTPTNTNELVRTEVWCLAMLICEVPGDANPRSDLAELGLVAAHEHRADEHETASWGAQHVLKLINTLVYGMVAGTVTGLVYELSDNPSKFTLQPLSSDRNDVFMYMLPVLAIGICPLSSPIFRVKSVHGDGSQNPEAAIG
ncbi:hypothetical protein K503DRAFT_783751 [Rhizopogon vinicolor AM-OR11-026]|uniref:Autophagy-related protein n=1 Tax=Rhizopogon vinicolor AM-OR11-026 TaxID=1314800 RepID=A0A1B7MXF4_9AGAM|nr:hypothetical protein K503DRAFT_783751 [Rhizopogon vinicolor AM-OR11-026]